jgi:hypothetical protein
MCQLLLQHQWRLCKAAMLQGQSMMLKARHTARLGQAVVVVVVSGVIVQVDISRAVMLLGTPLTQVTSKGSPQGPVWA